MNATRDIVFMLNPASWPRWPYLPLKRRDGNGWYECATLYAGETALHLCTMFEMSGPHEIKPYPSHEAIVKDGWIVD